MTIDRIAASVLVAALGLLPAGAGAAERSATLAAPSLAIDTPCARQVDIRPDPALHGQVVITATADNQGELDRLVFETRDAARISTGHQGCWRPDAQQSFSPTLELAVRVPANLPIAIDEGAAARYGIGPVGGNLSIDLSGAAQLRADQVAALTIDLSGAGDVDIGRVAGDAHIDLSGHGRVNIADAAIPALDMDLSGAGALNLAHGQIGSVKLDESGFGAITIGAVVGSANVEISGAGSVRLAKVTGTLTKDISGIGTIKVGD